MKQTALLSRRKFIGATAAAFGASARFVWANERETNDTDYQNEAEYYVDCSANPHDLRSSADTILSAAFGVRNNLPEDKPLVILIGEHHMASAHVELQHLVISRLKEQQARFTFNLELSHNTWSVIAKRNMKYKLPEELYYNSSSYDPEGQAVLSAYCAYRRPQRAPNSLHSLMGFCLKQKIATAFNDAARRAKGLLDFADPITAEMARDYFSTSALSGLDVITTSHEGIAVRNKVMAKSAMMHAEKHHASIIVQNAGMGHVLGLADKGWRYEESLCTTYKEQGAEVLPVLVTANYGLNDLPREAHAELRHSVVVDGLASDGFQGMYSNNRERAFIRKLHEQSGRELSFYDVKEKRADYKRHALSEAQRIMDAF